MYEQVPQPPLAAINTMLELLMEDLNLTEDKKQVLRQLSVDRKWVMLQQHLGERYRDNASRDLQQEIADIRKLANTPDREILTDLVVSLRSRPIRWISNFIDNGGLAILLTNLRLLNLENRHDEHEELYIKCLKSLMNNKIGLSAVLDHTASMTTIAASLRSPSFRTRALVLEIFGAVCLIPGGHRCVLEGMEALAELASMRFRFEPVVSTLWLSCQGVSPLEKELQVACMSFVNAVICGGPGVNLEFRMHLRYEFLHLGLMQLIDKIGSIENDLLQTQIDVWIAGLEADEQEVFSRLNPATVASINMESSPDVFDAIYDTVKTSSCMDPFHSILKHIALLPADPFEKMKYLFVIDKVVQQICVQQDEENSDPSAALLDLDTKALIDDFGDITKSKQLEDKLKRALERSRKLEKDVDRFKEVSVAAEAVVVKKDEEIKTLSQYLASAKRDIVELNAALKGQLTASGNADLIARIQATLYNSQKKAPGAPGFAAIALPPPKATNLSSKPLKALNWTKIAPVKISETVFATLDDADVHQRMADTYSEFEDLFAAKELKEMKTGPGKGSNDSINVGKEISVLDPKRSQNTNIMLRAIKMPPSQIAQALETGDLTVLKPTVISELLKFIPTEEEIQALKQYETPAAANQDSGSAESVSPLQALPALATAERFFLTMGGIAHYEQKLRAMNFQASFDEFVGDAETMVSWLKRATWDVRDSKKLKELLKVILALGNYMNSGQRGGAYGFKLNTILKLGDTKSSIQSRKHTLLHYLTELVPRKFPDVVGFQDELTHVDDGSKVTIPQIRQSVITIRDNLNSIKALLSKMEKDASSSPNAAVFLEAMSAFHVSASAVYADLDTRFKSAEKEFEALVVLYGEDPRKTTPEEFFGVFRQFLTAYAQAKVENEMAAAKVIEDEKKEAVKRHMEERRTKKRQKDPATAAPTAAAMPSSLSAASGDTGASDGLDDLISAIRSGKAFGGLPERKRAAAAAGGVADKPSMRKHAETVGGLTAKESTATLNPSSAGAGSSENVGGKAQGPRRGSDVAAVGGGGGKKPTAAKSSLRA
ncbi:hypothetical protein HDU82_002067 [Entophlyctis luteolus]|nr:hypothetical protein HDU82_002067 [Entophlyctis luteolus]